MSMIEKLARVLAGWTPNMVSWEGMCEHAEDAEAIQKYYHKQARAVLQSLREPSEGMLDAAWEQSGESKEMRERTHARYKHYFRAMIDKALEEG